ncbi:hypothetical protein MKW98_022522, partial [Papaver atlanticum]
MKAYERSRVLFRFADLIDKHTNELAALETRDSGKPHEQAAQIDGQIRFMVSQFRLMVGPALATGNSSILKTAEQTSLSALHAGKLLNEAGIPEGALNVISGFGPKAGAALSSHMDVDKLAFTGSTVTGKKIVTELAGRSNLKPVTLELGGKSPFILLKLLTWLCSLTRDNAGSRTFVHEKVYDEFMNHKTSYATITK